MYDTRPGNIPSYEQEFRAANPLKKAGKGGTRIRNLNKAAQEAQELASAPDYQRRVQVTQLPTGEKVYDPYDYWRQGPISKEDEHGFTFGEQSFMNLMLMKNDYLTKQMWRE